LKLIAEGKVAMRPDKLLNALRICLLFACALPLLAQSDDLYSQIKPLETAVSSNSATHDQLVQLARLYIQGGRYYEASKIASRLLAQDPNDVDAAQLRDDSAAKLREVSTLAIAQAEANAAREGATDQDRLALANAYFDGGKYTAAADAYAKLPADTRDRTTRLREARALAWSSKYDAAERAYSALLREQSTPDVQLEYGRLLSWMGANRAAADALRSAHGQLANEESVIALANAEAWSGDRDHAIRMLTDFTDSHPDAAQARQLLAGMRTSPDVRIERMNKLIELDPYNLALRVDRARMELDATRYNEALNDVHFVRDHSLQRVDGLDELEGDINTRRAAELAKLGDQLKALQSRSPQDPDAVLSLAKAYTALADYDDAIRLYEQYLAARPDDTNARVQYARVLGWDKRYSAAGRQYEKVLEQNPDRADLRLEYAQVLSYDSNFGGAIHMFSSLTDLKDNPRANLYTDVPQRAYYNLGQIYRWFGWSEHAAVEQNRALALDSAYFPAAQELDIVRHVRPATTLDARYTYATDSNDFTMRRIDLDGEKWTSQRTAFDLGVGRHEFEHFGDRVSANAFNVGGLYRASDRTLLRARVGANFYESGLGTRPFFGVGAEWRPSIESRTALDYNHYDLVYDVFTLTSLTTPSGTASLFDPLSIDDLRAHADYATGGHWAALADASYGRITDRNKRFAGHALASFRVFKAPFVALKADGRMLRYDFRTPRYWSPTDYKSLAGILQVGQNIKDRFFWNAELKYGRSWEGSNTSDLRSYEANVTVPVSDAFDLVGNYGYGKSGRLDSILGSSGTDFVNYWQRHWYVGVRLKRLFARDDRRGENPYYFDNRSLTSSPVVPETH
jgi:tetratricopeptide (TPR) repeat protein